MALEEWYNHINYYIATLIMIMQKQLEWDTNPCPLAHRASMLTIVPHSHLQLSLIWIYNHLNKAKGNISYLPSNFSIFYSQMQVWVIGTLETPNHSSLENNIKNAWQWKNKPQWIMSSCNINKIQSDENATIWFSLIQNQFV